MSLVVISLSLAMAAVAGTVPSTYGQTLLDEAVKGNPSIVAASLHITPPKAAANVVVASTVQSGIGAKTSPTILKIMATNATSSALNGSGDRYTPVYGAVYSSRLDPFMQLDIRFDKTWTYNRWRFAMYIDIQNVTNRANPEAVSYSFDYKQTSPVAGLPLLPVFGLRGDF